MNIEKEKEAFEKSYAEMLIGGELKGLESVIFAKYLESGEYAQDKVDTAWCMWQAAKAQAVSNTQALHDRLLVESIKDHVDSHLAESESAIDYFDKGWFAAMRCVRHNIDMLEAQEQNQ